MSYKNYPLVQSIKATKGNFWGRMNHINKDKEGLGGSSYVRIYSTDALHQESLVVLSIFPVCRERERMKQLTLEISERQEQEELSEALQQLQRVTLGEQMRD